MTARSSLATVIEVDTHPLTLRRRAERRALAVAPAVETVTEAARALQVRARTAQRADVRQVRHVNAERATRLIVFRPLIPFHTLWRRWCRGVPFSRLWCAPAKLAVSFPSLDDPAQQLKRSPRPAGAHRLRDLSATRLRRQPHGRAG
jgi:hypothetical protein